MMRLRQVGDNLKRMKKALRMKIAVMTDPNCKTLGINLLKEFMDMETSARRIKAKVAQEGKKK